MIKARHIQKNYGLLMVLPGISFSLGRGQKVALVGHNGAGKTTLLKIIAGLEEPDGGKIEIASNACVGYLPQDTSLSGDESIVDYLKRVSGIEALEREMRTVSAEMNDPESVTEHQELLIRYEHLEGYSFTHKVEVMLSGFGLDEVELGRLLSNLSSGQKGKVALVGILLKGVDLLLLDEPTNNLDLPALIWLEDFLKKSEATCIIVSHDRRFLDRVVRKIFELDWRTRALNITGGTYSDYLEAVAKKIESQKEEYRLQQGEMDRLNERAREKKADSNRGARWSPSDNDKFLKGFKRERAGRSGKGAKAIEKRIEQMEVVEKPVERKPFEIPLEAQVASGARDVRLSDVVTGYQGFSIGPISFGISYGERVGIIGLNGSGKSTLLKIITGQQVPVSGEVEIGRGLRIGNMMQEHETLTREHTLLEFLSEKTGFSRQEAYAKLAKFGFDERQVRLPIGALSPGGRARLLLALFSAQSVNMLVLDEPTNHLDLEALDALEETLSTYRGTVLLVSHDRYFLEKASLDTTYVLSDGVLTKIPDYKTYVESAEEKALKLIKLL